MPQHSAKVDFAPNTFGFGTDIGVDDQERLAFLKTLADKVNKPASQDAYIYATVAVASIELQLGHYEGARKKLDECERILDSFNLVETVVHASFYRTNADYYKVRYRTVSGISNNG